MNRFSRRGWNNIVILGIIVFMVILNLPTMIKENFLQAEQEHFPYVLRQDLNIKAMHFSQFSITREDVDWVADRALQISPLELVQRWQALAGTELDDGTFAQLKAKLPKANTVEVWYIEAEEPQRVTYYQTPQFWLMKGWQEKWIAISVESNYLFPIQ